MTENFVVVHERPAERLAANWRKCLNNTAFATHYVAPEFFDEPGFRGKQPFAVLAVAGDNVTGVLTGHREGRHLRCGLSVRPQVVCATTSSIADSAEVLLQGVLEEGRSCELIDLFSWSLLPPLISRQFACRQEKGVVLLDLTETPQLLFRKFSENKRTNIKKAIKRGVAVERTRNETDILAFYEIARDWSKRKQISPPNKDVFVESLLCCGYRHLFVARHDSVLLAGVVVRGYPGGIIEYAANSSRPEFLHLRPNDLLHWRIIEWACEEGFTKYSLGGTHLFLRKFGGPIIPTYRYRFDNSFLRHHTIREVIEQSITASVKMLPRFMGEWGKTVLQASKKVQES